LATVQMAFMKRTEARSFFYMFKLVPLLIRTWFLLQSQHFHICLNITNLVHFFLL